ncbi:unnamed protein product, partial [Ectocarpus sp. 8 AP-2014]
LVRIVVKTRCVTFAVHPPGVRYANAQPIFLLLVRKYAPDSIYVRTEVSNPRGRRPQLVSFIVPVLSPKSTHAMVSACRPADASSRTLRCGDTRSANHRCMFVRAVLYS